MKRGESLHDETAPLDRCRRFGRCAPPGRARLRPGGRASTGRMNIRQLAKLCGVSRTTVSHALRDDRAVAESTRERVRRLAAEHDYHPDPDVALQMRRIASKGRSAHASTIAMISPWPEQRAWRNNWILEQFHDGIIDRSEELGYRVDEFWVRAPGMSLSRLNLILSYRGIRGAVVLNHPEIAGVAPFDFQGIAAVVLGRALVQPDLPAVDHDHFGGLNLALRELAGRGYRKIGLALFDDFQERERTDRQWEAAFLLQQQTVPPRRRVPIFVGRKADASQLETWFRRHRPDAVVSDYAWAAEILRGGGAQVPEKTGFACLMWRDPGDACAGIDMNCTEAGRIATELLHLRLGLRQRSGEEFRRTTLVAGCWRDGPSAPGAVRRRMLTVT